MARAVVRAHGGELALAEDGYVLTLPVDEAAGSGADQ
jgi:hypothetical protein